MLRIVLTFGREAELSPRMARDDRALGGIRTAIGALSLALAQRGHDVHVFARSTEPGQDAGVTWHDRSTFASFARGDAVDALVVVPPVLPLLMPLRARARVVWTGNAFQHGDCMLAVPYRWAPQLGRAGTVARLYPPRVWAPYADRIVTKSCWQAAYMRERLFLPESLFTVLYNGVQLDHYQAAPVPLSVRHRHRLVYTSEARRGLDVLLHVFPRIRAAVPDAELHIFGYEYAAGTSVTHQEGEVQPGVVWRGRVDKKTLADELQHAAVMAYPCTLKETFCTAVAEAQAAGLPVVASAKAALVERVTAGADGVLIAGSPHDPDFQHAFVVASVNLLSDDVLWARMSTSAARMARHAYDWGAIAARWEDELRGLAAARAPALPQVVRLPAWDDPALLAVSDRGVQGVVPAELALRCLHDTWASFGLDPGLLPCDTGGGGRRGNERGDRT